MAFANIGSRGRKLRHKSRWGRATVAIALALLFTILLFFFEWLGSEQPQKWVEEPVTMPDKVVKPVKNKD
jgi:hypothetical protein